MTLSKSRPWGYAARKILGITEPEPINYKAAQYEDRVIGMRLDFYQHPPIRQTKSFKRIDGGMIPVDGQIEREHCHERVTDPRQRAILAAHRLGDRVDAVSFVLADLIAEESRRRDVLDEAENVRDNALLSGSSIIALAASRECNDAAAACWTVGRSRREHGADLRQYPAVADAVVRELTTAIGSSDRDRARRCFVDKMAYRRHFRAPYEWALETWRVVLRTGMLAEAPDY